LNKLSLRLVFVQEFMGWDYLNTSFWYFGFVGYSLVSFKKPGRKFYWRK